MNIAKKSKFSKINIFCVIGVLILLGTSQLQAQDKRDHRTKTKTTTKHTIKIANNAVDNDCDDDVAVNNKEFVDAIAKDAGLSKADSGNVLNAFVCNITKSLKKGNSVQLIGFGTFSIYNKAARTGRNPQTGAPITIAAKKVVKFNPGKELEAAVNKVSKIDEDSDGDGLFYDVAMNKGELVDAIAKDTGLRMADAGNALHSIVSNITKSLKKGDKVALIGFGTFSTSYLAARTGSRNPQTGAAIKIAAKKVVRFKAGSELGDPKK